MPGSPALAATAALDALLHGDGTFAWTHWDIHPSVLLGCLALAGGYLAAIGPLRGRFITSDDGAAGPAGAERADAAMGAGDDGAAPATGATTPASRPSAARIAAFLGGVVVLFVALNGPIHDLSDYYLFSAHMVQHMLLMMIMPPLLLIGMPAWLVRPVLRRRGAYRTARWLTHPAIAFAIYNIVFVAWHFPGLYNLALENHDVHIVQHLMFMAAAVLMWWPVVNPVPELKRIGRPMQLLYLFLFGIPMSAVSAMITFADGVLYPFYAEAPRVFELSARADQQLGGLIMWVPGMIVYWAAVSIVFYHWAQRENREEAQGRRRRELARAHR